MYDSLCKYKKTAVIILFFTLILAAFLLCTYTPVFAQGSVNDMLWGGREGEVRQATGLGSDDPRIVIARIIQIFLGFMGIIALLLIIYAGWLWMNSQGEPEKINQAKSVLKGAFVGLVIILSSFGIVTFILNALYGATGAGRTGPTSPGGMPGGIGALGNCTLESVYPYPDQEEVPRNTPIIVTFREELDPSTVMDGGGNMLTDGRIKIYRENSSTDLVTDVKVSFNSAHTTFVLRPRQYLGNSSEKIWYRVELDNRIQKADGVGVFQTCGSFGGTYYSWRFEVSTKLDLDPPMVLEAGVFPTPDNSSDTYTPVEAQQSQGEITVQGTPNIHTDAAYTGAGRNTPDPTPIITSVTMDPNSTISGDLQIVTSNGSSAQLQRVDVTPNILLGSANIQGGNTFIFPGILTIVLDGAPNPNDSWYVNGVTAMIPDDTFRVGDVIYRFRDPAPQNNEILLQTGDTTTDIAFHIASKLTSSNPVATGTSAGNVVTVGARTLGLAGNYIALSTSNSNTIEITFSMDGGRNAGTEVTAKGYGDKARNAIIKINFNEPMYPLTLEGKADDIQSYIRIVNAEPGAYSADKGCTEDSQCASLVCDGGKCVGSYLPGEFTLSNLYRTVEFRSDDVCGVNGCGEKIYCLPGLTHIRVELNAATLEGCIDCDTKPPFIDCHDGHCYNSATLEFHPLASLVGGEPDGITDLAFNSLNGDRDIGAEGPVDYYDENETIAMCDALTPGEGKICTVGDENTVCGAAGSCHYPNGDPVIDKAARVANRQSNPWDSYTWSFFISDRLDLTPPKIDDPTNPSMSDGTTPLHTTSDVSLSDPVIINFNKPMMSSSLNSGQIVVSGKSGPVIHKRINIRSFSELAVGYWITSSPEQIGVPDNEIDWTRAYLNHTLFPDAMTFRTQVGSGVKDIYQNCFKPVVGPSGGAGECTGTEVSPNPTPSCCPDAVMGTMNPTGVLSPQGNCP